MRQNTSDVAERRLRFSRKRADSSEIHWCARCTAVSRQSQSGQRRSIMGILRNRRVFGRALGSTLAFAVSVGLLSAAGKRVGGDQSGSLAGTAIPARRSSLTPVTRRRRQDSSRGETPRRLARGLREARRRSDVPLPYAGGAHGHRPTRSNPELHAAVCRAVTCACSDEQGGCPAAARFGHSARPIAAEAKRAHGSQHRG